MKKSFIIVPLCLTLFAACHIASVEPPVSVPITLIGISSGMTLHDAVTITAVPGAGLSFTHVDFYIDSVLVKSDSILPFQFYWNIFNYSTNIHSVFAVGYTAADSIYRTATARVNIAYVLGFSLASDYRPSSQHAVGATATQNFLFVAMQDQGVEVIDISNIISPQFMSRFVTGGLANHVAASDPFIFIANGTQGVVKADYTDPSSLMETARFIDQGLVKDVKIIGNNILVAENGAVVLIGGNNPDSLVELSRLAIQAVFYYAATLGDLAFVAGDNGLYIIDCSNPDNIVLLSTFNNLGLSLGVAVTDTFAFVANGDLGVTAISTADPSNPMFLGRFNPEPYIVTVAIGDNTLFAGAREGDIYAFGFDTADTLIQLDHFTTGNLIGEINYRSPYLFVAANSAIQILRFII